MVEKHCNITHLFRCVRLADFNIIHHLARILHRVPQLYGGGALDGDPHPVLAVHQALDVVKCIGRHSELLQGVQGPERCKSN